MKTLMSCSCIIILALAGCSGVNVLETHPDKSFQLDRYKTFDFFELEASGDTAKNFLRNAGLLKQAITRELESKGLRQSSSAPDLLVNIGIVVEQKVQTRETSFQEAPLYVGQRRYHWESEKVEVGRYRVGTVTVDLVDSKDNTRVWEGAVEGVIPERQEARQKRIDKGVEALFDGL
jgi:hypothetical protein